MYPTPNEWPYYVDPMNLPITKEERKKKEWNVMYHSPFYSMLDAIQIEWLMEMQNNLRNLT